MARAVLDEVEGVLRTYPSGEVLKVACSPGFHTENVESALKEAGVSVSSVEQVAPTFEDVFLSWESRKDG